MTVRRFPSSDEARRTVNGERPLELFVNGTLMRGLALHGNLAGAKFLGEARTAPIYRLYSIDDSHPGMFQVAEGGISVPGEIYRLPPEVWQRVEAGEPPNLYRGPVRLADGRVIDGILYPRELAEDRQRDISDYGGWREYCAARDRDRSPFSLPSSQRSSTDGELTTENG